MCKKNVTSVTVPINRLTYLVHVLLRFFGMYPAMGAALYRRGVMDNLAR